MPDDQSFLSDIQSSSADTRFAAWRQAGNAFPASGMVLASIRP